MTFTVTSKDSIFYGDDEGVLRVGRHGDEPVAAEEIMPSIRDLNAALSDADPRKITREVIQLLQRAEISLIGAAFHITDDVARAKGWDDLRAVRRLAAALESYLPPETVDEVHFSGVVATDCHLELPVPSTDIVAKNCTLV